MIIKETKTVVLMDEKRGLMAYGVPRNRYVGLVGKDARILTYTTVGRARANCTRQVGFYTDDGVREYLEREYGIVGKYKNWVQWREYYHLFGPVEVVLRIEEIDPS